MARADFSSIVKNGRMKQVLSDCSYFIRGNGERHPVYEKSHHWCVCGPQTWYRRAGISLQFWNGKSPKTVTVEDMKTALQRSGMVAVWAGTGQQANQLLTSSKYLRPGDVASMLSADSAHGVMWTGEDWRSDFYQNTKPYPYSSVGRGGSQTFILWRHPDLQEPGLDVKGDGLGNPMGSGGLGGSSGGGAREWPDFNLKDFTILNDEKGKYTNEPLLLGIANHLHVYGGGTSGDLGDIGDVAGNSPFSSADDFLARIDWNKCEKYAAGVYQGMRSKVMNRKISSVPSDFLSNARSYSQKSGLPVAALVMIAQSESNFKNCPKNKYGYGGYFGSKTGPEGSFDMQADVVKNSFMTAKNNSPGADNLAVMVLMYISHHLPAVGSKYWNATGGKIWSGDADYIAENACKCWPPLRSKSVTLAEHIMVNLSAQYMALQLRSKSF